MTDVIRGQGQLQSVAIGFASLWAVNHSGHELVRFEARTGAVMSHIPVERSPQGVAVGAGAVWVTRASPRALVRIDPATNTAVSTYPAEDGWGFGDAVLVTDEGLWVGDLARLDPATGKLIARSTAAGGDAQFAFAIGGGSAWIAEATKIRQVPLALLR